VEPALLDDLFDRQDRVPGSRRWILQQADILLVGAGGLNSWAGLALARSGATRLTVVEHDPVEISNLPRQLYFAGDVGKLKANSLIENLARHAIAGARLTAIPLPFEEALRQREIAADLIVCGVDNNPCRLACVREARRRGVPAVFTMLSADGMVCHAFLQGPRPDDPCLWCAVPHLDVELTMPCVPAVITSCLLACAYTVSFAHRALMGWPDGVPSFNWREGDLLGRYPDRTGLVRRRPDCPVCSAKP
jgi:molybdopterin/thiamine biosynthesis adenylyltransferase